MARRADNASGRGSNHSSLTTNSRTRIGNRATGRLLSAAGNSPVLLRHIDRVPVQRERRDRPGRFERYQHAHNYLTRWFGHQTAILDVMNEAMEVGLKGFVERSKIREPSSAFVLAVFESVLGLVPGGGPLLKAFKMVNKGSYVGAAVKLSTGLRQKGSAGSGPLEHVAGIVDAVAAGAAAPPAKLSKVAAMDLEISSRILADYSSRVGDVMRQEQVLIDLLRGSYDRGDDLDFETIVKVAVGPIPSAVSDAVAVAERFELDLYSEYYLEKGRAHVVVTVDHWDDLAGAPQSRQESRIVGVPVGVRMRLDEKRPGWTEDLPVKWRTVRKRVTGHTAGSGKRAAGGQYY